MKHMAVVCVVSVIAIVGLAGCAQSEMPPTEGESSVRWEEAKAAAQARELEIVSLIPSEEVTRVDQHEKGGLFNCSETQHRWKGITDVTLTSGADVEAVTRKMEDRVADFFPVDEFEMTSYRDITDSYVLVLRSLKTGEGYLFGEGEPGTISIDSWSVCFTLPEGVYPGGDF